jgi:hypothetical protein
MRSVYECNHCGEMITEAERVLAVRAGHWEWILKPEDREGRHPGFHVRRSFR